MCRDHLGIVIVRRVAIEDVAFQFFPLTVATKIERSRQLYILTMESKFDHSGANGHWVKCICDICDLGVEIGFYTCTCDDCDPDDNQDRWRSHERRHKFVCECGDVYTCINYPHTSWKPGLNTGSTCDCNICSYDPIIMCDNTCPICSHTAYVDYARDKYIADRQENEQPIIIATRESSLFKYEIQQWSSPASMFVVAIPKQPPLEPIVETLVMGVADAYNAIDDQIASEPMVPKVVSRKWSDIPNIVKKYLSRF
jgi:hypothetical protein